MSSILSVTDRAADYHIVAPRTQWHPTKPSMASTTSFGNVLIWHCPTPERWGAFAGGFEEVDENVEYEEQEGEFDIVRPFPEFRRRFPDKRHWYHRKMRTSSRCERKRPRKKKSTLLASEMMLPSKRRSIHSASLRETRTLRGRWRSLMTMLRDGK